MRRDPKHHHHFLHSQANERLSHGAAMPGLRSVCHHVADVVASEHTLDASSERTLSEEERQRVGDPILSRDR
jgi:hypothetical protein